MHMHMQMHIFISNEYLVFKKHEICKMHPPYYTHESKETSNYVHTLVHTTFI